jgi:hypothetical protein
MWTAEKKGFKAWLQLEKSLLIILWRLIYGTLKTDPPVYHPIQHSGSTIDQIILSDLQSFSNGLADWNDCQFTITHHLRYPFFSHRLARKT